MLEWQWLGLDFGQWLAIVVLVVVIGAAARYVLLEWPRDRKSR